jgi:hypothetical protein
MDNEYGKNNLMEFVRAVKAINPDAAFTVKETNGVSTIEWLEGTTPISIETITAKQIELAPLRAAEKQAEEDAKVSAVSKLKAIGLNDAEVKAIVGVSAFDEIKNKII